MLDLMNVMGMSASLLRGIEKRHAVDRAIVFGGMLLTLLVVYLTLRWVRG